VVTLERAEAVQDRCLMLLHPSTWWKGEGIEANPEHAGICLLFSMVGRGRAVACWAGKTQANGSYTTMHLCLLVCLQACSSALHRYFS